jgi:hypothetical protein
LGVDELSSSGIPIRVIGTIVLLLLLFSARYFASTEAVFHVHEARSDTNQAIQGEFVDLTYLVGHLAEFENRSITTNGTVGFYASIYMFEDFWLESQSDAKIPVVTRFSGLPVPTNGSLNEVSGRIEHSNLEGGFYFLNASSWKVPIVPEFSAGALLLFLMFAICAVGVLVIGRSMQGRRTESG